MNESFKNYLSLSCINTYLNYCARYPYVLKSGIVWFTFLVLLTVKTVLYCTAQWKQAISGTKGFMWLYK